MASSHITECTRCDKPRFTRSAYKGKQKLATDLARADLRYADEGGRNCCRVKKKVGRREKGARRIGVEAIGKKAGQMFATGLERR